MLFIWLIKWAQTYMFFLFNTTKCINKSETDIHLMHNEYKEEHHDIGTLIHGAMTANIQQKAMDMLQKRNLCIFTNNHPFYKLIYARHLDHFHEIKSTAYQEIGYIWSWTVFMKIKIREFLQIYLETQMVRSSLYGKGLAIKTCLSVLFAIVICY